MHCKSSMRSMGTFARSAMRDRRTLRGPARLERLEQVVQPVHRHPRAVRAALAGGALAGGRRLDEGHAGMRLRIWWMMPPSVATMYSFAPQRSAAWMMPVVEPPRRPCRSRRAATPGAPAPSRSDAELQLLELLRLELVVHDAAAFHISMSAPVTRCT
jgi:hypothetical protein